jgi:hypothetical protein
MVNATAEIKSCINGPPLRYGMCVVLTPIAALSNSQARWGMEPTRPEPNCMLSWLSGGQPFEFDPCLERHGGVLLL